MSKEKYISPATLLEFPKKVLHFILKDSAVTTNKVADSSITPEKLSPRVDAELVQPKVDKVQDNIDNEAKARQEADTALQKTITALDDVKSLIVEITADDSMTTFSTGVKSKDVITAMKKGQDVTYKVTSPTAGPYYYKAIELDESTESVSATLARGASLDINVEKLVHSNGTNVELIKYDAPTKAYLSRNSSEKNSGASAIGFGAELPKITLTDKTVQGAMIELANSLSRESEIRNKGIVNTNTSLSNEKDARKKNDEKLQGSIDELNNSKQLIVDVTANDELTTFTTAVDSNDVITAIKAGRDVIYKVTCPTSGPYYYRSTQLDESTSCVSATLSRATAGYVVLDRLNHYNGTTIEHIVTNTPTDTYLHADSSQRNSGAAHIGFGGTLKNATATAKTVQGAIMGVDAALGNKQDKQLYITFEEKTGAASTITTSFDDLVAAWNSHVDIYLATDTYKVLLTSKDDTSFSGAIINGNTLIEVTVDSSSLVSVSKREISFK